MKKVAFIHATVRVANANNKPSLILEKVPEGLLSQVRELNGDQEETILESVLKDFALIPKLDEIVVITSLDDVDTAIVDHISALDVGKKIKWYRVSDEDSFAITEDNKASYDGHWPYERLAVYGAWHYQGFFEIAKTNNAEVVLLVNADQALMCDCAYVSKLLDTYTQKGVWLEPLDKRMEFGLLNVAFMEGLFGKYKTRMESFSSRKNNKLGIRIDKALKCYQEDTARKDFILSPSVEAMPMFGLYTRQERNAVLSVYARDTQKIREVLESTSLCVPGGMPALQHIEIIGEEGNVLSPSIFLQCVTACAANGSIVNMITRAWNEPHLADCLRIIEEHDACAFLEIHAHCLKEVSQSFVRTVSIQVKLFHIHADTDTDSAVLAALLENLYAEKEKRHFFVVLEIAPNCIEKLGVLENRVDKLLIKSNGAVKEAVDMIDFSPFTRVPCKKIDHSAMLWSDGTMSLCQYLPGTKALHGSSIKKCYTSEEFKRIRDAQVMRSFDVTEQCAQCKEWYIPEAVYNTGNMLFPSVVEKLAQQSSYADYDVATAKRVLAEFVVIDDLCQKSVQECVVVDSRHRIASSSGWRFATAFKKLFIPLGDRLCQLGEVEKALDAWERVLKYDPSNEYIHGRLDELLASVDAL